MEASNQLSNKKERNMKNEATSNFIAATEALKQAEQNRIRVRLAGEQLVHDAKVDRSKPKDVLKANIKIAKVEASAANAAAEAEVILAKRGVNEARLSYARESSERAKQLSLPPPAATVAPVAPVAPVAAVAPAEIPPDGYDANHALRMAHDALDGRVRLGELRISALLRDISDGKAMYDAVCQEMLKLTKAKEQIEKELETSRSAIADLESQVAVANRGIGSIS